MGVRVRVCVLMLMLVSLIGGMMLGRVAMVVAVTVTVTVTVTVIVTVTMIAASVSFLGVGQVNIVINIAPNALNLYAPCIDSTVSLQNLAVIQRPLAIYRRHPLKHAPQGPEEARIAIQQRSKKHVP